jgi:hypothetical protein
MPAKHDWSRLDAMSEAQKRSAAMNDPDNPPPERNACDTPKQKASISRPLTPRELV